MVGLIRMMPAARFPALYALLIFTGCAGVVSPGAASVLVLVFFLSVFSAGCRALLEPEDPAETALRLLLTRGTKYSAASCSGTQDYTRSFDFTTYDPSADGSGVRIDDNVINTNATGYSIGAAGDFNGDGLGDITFSAPGYNGGEGRVYIVYGSRTLSTLNLAVLSSDEGMFIRGLAAATSLGSNPDTVNAAGDVNGDGFDDIIIGASQTGGGTEGAAWLIYGKSNPVNVDLNSLSSADGVRFSGAKANGQAGWAVAGPGDVNGDGIDDVMIAEYYGGPSTPGEGRVYIAYGKRTGFASNTSLSSLTGNDGFYVTGEVSMDYLSSATGAGDINGDGLGDMIMGAFMHNASVGASYVIFGQSGTRSNIDLASLNSSDGYKISGATTAGNEYWGLSVDALNDFNGDGLNDVIVGAPYQTANTGSSAVLFGNTGGIGLTGLSASSGFFLTGAAGQYAGEEVRGGGDLNGDGLGDLIVGAPRANAADGQAFVVFGQSNPATAALSSLANGATGFRLDGDTGAGNLLGIATGFTRDFNGDFCDDLLITQSSTAITGNAYVIFGGRAR